MSEKMASMEILCLLLFTFSYLSNVSAGKHEEMVHSAVLVGSVYCDTCSHQEFSETSHFISGASVAIECQEGGAHPSFQKEVRTNEHGEFKVQLPFGVGKHEKMIKKCMVKLVRSSRPSCAVASRATSSSLHLKSRKHEIHVFSAGFFTFKPIKQPELCRQEANSASSSKFSFMKTNVPHRSYLSVAKTNRAQKMTSTKISKLTRFQPTAFFPPIFPSPPPFGLPLPPNPFQPPPLLPPLPFVPSPPPFINIPPLPFFTPPPPPPFINLPPLPFFTPPPSPPPPPFFNLPPFPHLPPLPSIPFFTPPPPPPPSPPPPTFLPIPPITFPPLPPIFPGIPPASPSKNAHP